MDIIKITSDKEMARSILKMVELIEDRIKVQDPKKMAALIISDYYEIIKELNTSILLLDGYKTLSHKKLIEYLDKFDHISEYEISLLDDLRVLRNRITYEGFFVDSSYLERNEKVIKGIVEKLKKIVVGGLDG